MSVQLREDAREAVNRRLHDKRPGGGAILAHPADVHCVVFHLLVVAAYATAFLLYLHPQWARIGTRTEMAAFVAAAVLLLGWVSGINVGVNFHNHVHLRVFRYGWLNRWFGRLWAVTGGWPSRFWKHAHVTVHHADTLGPDDWTLPRRRPDGSFEGYWKYCLLHWPWRYARHLWRDFRSGAHPTFRQEAPREMLIFCALYAVPFCIDPLMGLLLWLAPHFLANVLIMGSGMYVQHVDCDRESDAHPFRHSNTFRSRFFNLTMFNIGYHNVHHSFAHVHWSDLPEFHHLLQDSLDADGAAEVRIGYFRASVELAHGRSWPGVVTRFGPPPAASPAEHPGPAAGPGAPAEAQAVTGRGVAP
jgi:fatty acid desaturase